MDLKALSLNLKRNNISTYISMNRPIARSFLKTKSIMLRRLSGKGWPPSRLGGESGFLAEKRISPHREMAF